ncbi:MAG: hypothetical protein GOP50_02220 [Candidatus Heimdallarchaeota archaeon]|nr:hypothetical protein [Candidatus Heimdallarchaeota archaeon]
MSQELPLEEAYDWFNSRVSSNMSSYRNNAAKQLRSIKDKIEEVKSAAHRFDYSDIKDPDVYQNYATTIHTRINEIFGDFETPEEITFRNLEDFLSNTQSKISACMNMLSKYLSWLKRDRSYKDKVKSLDRTLTRLKEDVFHFENKTMVSYSEITKFEKVLDDIGRLIQLVERNYAIEEEIETHADDVAKITKEIDKNQESLDELKNHPGFVQLQNNRKELERIEITVSNKLSEIKKLSSKVLKAVDNKKVEIHDYDKETLKSMIKDPLSAFVKEPEGYNGIKSSLRVLKEISTEPAIQMKKEKLKRAYENIDEILNNELLEYQKNAQFLIKQSEAIEYKFQDMQLDLNMKKFKQEIDNLKIDRNRITLALRREKTGIEEEIKTVNKSIEEHIDEFTNRSVKLIF